MYGWMGGVLLAGLAARWYFSTLGHNYDFESYQVVAGLMDEGKNVYANTDRYNYGPVWFNVIHLLDVLAGRNPEVFRGLLVVLLSAADAGIAWILWRRVGALAAILFFLNPVSMMITGYHNQFDNVAVLLGLWSVVVYGENFEKPPGGRQFGALAVLGLSLMTKHLLFVFPLWLAVKQKGWWAKGVVLALPVAIFLLGFAPYWADGKQGIIDHVFRYHSLHVACLYNLVMPGFLQSMVSAQAFWLAILAGFACFCRRRTALDSLLIYLAVMVAAAPATMNQYLAIPSAFTSVFVNFSTVIYTLAAAFHLATDTNGLHLMGHVEGGSTRLATAIYCLGFAVVWTMWREPVMKFLGSKFGRRGAKERNGAA